MNNKKIMLNIVRAKKEEETLEQLAQRVSKASQEEKKFQQEKYFLVDEPSPTTSVELSEDEEEELRQTVIRAAQASRPEKDTNFLVSIPDLHHSWFALKVISENTRLQEVYAMIMQAIYQEDFPIDAEVRILCLDKVDKFACMLNRCGHQWSRRAKTIMRTQHNKLYDKLFGDRPVYFTFD